MAFSRMDGIQIFVGLSLTFFLNLLNKSSDLLGWCFTNEQKCEMFVWLMQTNRRFWGLKTQNEVLSKSGDVFYTKRTTVAVKLSSSHSSVNASSASSISMFHLCGGSLTRPWKSGFIADQTVFMSFGLWLDNSLSWIFFSSFSQFCLFSRQTAFIFFYNLSFLFDPSCCPWSANCFMTFMIPPGLIWQSSCSAAVSQV